MKNKNNNTGGKWAVAIFVFVVICSIAITELLAANEKIISEIDIAGYKNELAIENEKLILLTESDCTQCDEMSNVLEDIKTLKDINVYSINVDKLSAADKNELLGTSDLIDIATLPVILHVSTGKVLGTYTADANLNDILSFMKVFKTTTVGDYVELLTKKGEYIVYIGRPTCYYCAQSEPWLKRIAIDLGKDIYYINTDEETVSNLNLLIEKTEEVFSGATPLYIILKDGKIIDYQEGAGSYAALRAFFNVGE